MAQSICLAHAENIGLESGGTVRVVGLSKSLADYGYDIHLVAPKPKNPDRIPDGLSDVTLHFAPIKARSVFDQFPRALLVSRKAKQVVDKHDALLQIERGTLAGVATLLGCSDYVVDLHDIGFDGPLYQNLPLSNPIQKFVYKMEKRGVEEASKVISVSDAMAKYVETEWGVHENSSFIVHNGVRSKVFNFNNPNTSEEDGMVAFIGSINYNIDYEKFIHLAQSIDGIDLHVIGDGYKRKELEEEVNRRDLPNIHVHGFLPDGKAYTILRRSQVCVFPLMDTHHTRVAQHMKGFDYGALGKAIATDRDGTAGILEENNAALVSDTGTPNELVSNVRRLLSDDSLRAELGANAKELAEEFTWEAQGEALASVYDGPVSS